MTPIPMRARFTVALLACALVACDDFLEDTPRVTPASESLWMLVGLHMKLDGVRLYLVENPGRSFSPTKIDEMLQEVVATSEYLTVGPLGDDELRAARYRVDLIALGWGLIQVDVAATSEHLGGVTHAGAVQGMGWVSSGLEHIREDPLWPVKQPVEADRITTMAGIHRSNLQKVVPAAALMRDGVNAASVISGAIATARLARAGAAALGRLVGFLGEGGAGPAYVTAGFAGGVGSVQVLAGGRVLVLTTEEVIALANAGAISAGAFAVYMAATNLHHICTDKNYVSDRQGGPWSPRFKEYFEKAGMTPRDPENLVKVKAHRGPHPRAYHEDVRAALREGTKGVKPNTPEYRKALKDTLAKLAKEIQTPGTRLNKLITEVASK